MARREKGFVPDLDLVAGLLEDPSQGIDTVIVCNPNNPTGVLLGRDELLSLVSDHPGVCFVVDESYLPFVDGAESISLVGETRFPNLLVLSSMSKIFSIPGLRTGFITAAPEIIHRFMASYQPWSVNALAQATLVHILGNPGPMEAFVRETRAFVRMERTRFEERMAACPGLTLLGSTTPFLLAEITSGATSAQLCREIGDRRILIRDCANFEGLSDRFVRFSLKTREVNMTLASLLLGSSLLDPGLLSGNGGGLP
jgi:threonine-phosphate decarboxylase